MYVGGAMAGLITGGEPMLIFCFFRGCFLGRNAARLYQCAFGYLAGRTDKRRSTFGYVLFLSGRQLFVYLDTLV